MEMKKSRIYFEGALSLVLAGTVILFSCTAPSKPLASQSNPLRETSRNMDKPPDGDTARKLYQLVSRENTALKWDDCLARKAHLRARYLVGNHRFTHKDPRTGRNPVWDMVKSCCEFRYAGENLVKGYLPPRALHDALMDSPSHRENILDRRYDRIGIGCYENICVQLFAGL